MSGTASGISQMADKDELRKQRNREAAHKSYVKKKAERERLQKIYDNHQNDQLILNRQIQRLTSLRDNYAAVIAGIQHVCNRHGSSTTSTGGPWSSPPPPSVPDLPHSAARAGSDQATSVFTASIASDSTARLPREETNIIGLDFISLGDQKVLDKTCYGFSVSPYAFQDPQTHESLLQREPQEKNSQNVSSNGTAVSEEGQPICSPVMSSFDQQSQAPHQGLVMRTSDGPSLGNMKYELVPSGADHDADRSLSMTTPSSNLSDLLTEYNDYNVHGFDFFESADNSDLNHQDFNAAEQLIASASMMIAQHPAAHTQLPSSTATGCFWPNHKLPTVLDCHEDLETDYPTSALPRLSAFSHQTSADNWQKEAENTPTSRSPQHSLVLTFESLGQADCSRTSPYAVHSARTGKDLAVGGIVPTHNQLSNANIVGKGLDISTLATTTVMPNPLTKQTSANSEKTCIKFLTNEEQEVCHTSKDKGLQNPDELLSLEDLFEPIDAIVRPLPISGQEMIASDPQTVIPQVRNAEKSCQQETCVDQINVRSQTDRRNQCQEEMGTVDGVVDINVKLKAKFQ